MQVLPSLAELVLEVRVPLDGAPDGARPDGDPGVVLKALEGLLAQSLVHEHRLA